MALLSSVTVPLFLPPVFPLGLYLGVGSGVGKRYGITPGHLPDAGGTMGKRVRLTRKTPSEYSHVIPDLGHPTPRRWKRLRPPSSEGVGGEVGEPRNPLPSTRGRVRSRTWGRLEPALGGNKRGGVPAGQSSRRDWRTGVSPI